MKRLLCVGSMVLAILGFAPRTSQASWVSDNCSPYNYEDNHVKRSEAQTYSAVAKNEGYEWGGGCWNNDDKDNSPNAPDSNGEGPDCSGFTFKTWELKKTWGQAGFQYWSKLENQHGPYTADAYHDASTSFHPFHRLNDWQDRSVTQYMDAFASSTHIGMLYTSSNPSSNTDWIIEAKGESWGTDENEEDYRYRSGYVGVRREGWTLDCWPNCSQDLAARLVVIR
jgi:hypothetical protein